MEILSASEMHDIAYEANMSFEKLMEKTMWHIQLAAGKGAFGIELPRATIVSEQVYKALENKGYYLKRVGGNVQISWLLPMPR